MTVADELEMLYYGTDLAYFKATFQRFPGGFEKITYYLNQHNTSVVQFQTPGHLDAKQRLNNREAVFSAWSVPMVIKRTK
jgi:hypothetical protein